MDDKFRFSMGRTHDMQSYIRMRCHRSENPHRFRAGSYKSLHISLRPEGGEGACRQYSTASASCKCKVSGKAVGFLASFSPFVFFSFHIDIGHGLRFHQTVPASFFFPVGFFQQYFLKCQQLLDDI